MNNRKAFTLDRPLIIIGIIIIIAMAFIGPRLTPTDTPTTETPAETDKEIHVDLSSLEQSNNIEKNTDLLRLFIISMKDGKEVAEFVEVISDFPRTRAEKIATAKGFAILKGYITKEEAKKLVFNKLDTDGGITVLEYYKPTQASL